MRCGRCCYNGGDMFGHSGIESGKCPYLDYDDKGLAVCLVEHCKPKVCRDYPFDSEPCELEKEILRNLIIK